jgi:hypothetical protein
MNGAPLRLISSRDRPSPAVAGVDTWQRIKDHARLALGRWSDCARLPGLVRPTRYNDPLTGNLIEVSVSGSATILSVNGRDYAFDRLTGRFTGTGTSLF